MSSPLTNYAEQSIPTVDDDENIWGAILNGAHAVWDRALGGVVSKSTTGGTTTLSASEGQSAGIVITGALTSAAIIEVPASRYRRYWVYNNTTGDYAVTVRTAGGSTGVTVPRTAYQMLASSSTTVVALGPPTSAGGGFPETLRNTSAGYDGPGLYFGSDRALGFARRGAGIMGVGLETSAGRDQIRFQGANTVGAPLLALMPPSGTFDWTTGLRPSVDDGILTLGFITAATLRAYVRNGLVVGLPTGFDKGQGTINAVGLYENGTRATVLWKSDPVSMTEGVTTTAHPLGAQPKTFGFVLQCAVSEYGYSVGNETTAMQWNTGSGQAGDYCLWADTTTLGLVFNDIYIRQKTGGGNLRAITLANWRIRFLASL